MRIRARRPQDGLDETGTTAVETSSAEEAAPPTLVSLLVEAGVAGESKLQQLAGEADAQGIGLGELVVARGLLDEEVMARLVARQWGLPFLERGTLTMDPAAARLLAFEQASTLRGCAIGIREGRSLVVVGHPSEERLDALRTQVETTSAGAPVTFAVVTASSLNGLLGQLARLSGRRPDPAPDRPPLARTAQPTNGNRAEQIVTRPTSSDRLLAELQEAAATEHTLQARVDRLRNEREAAHQQIQQLQQQIEQLKQQIEAADQQHASERDHDGELQVRLDQLASEREAADQQIGELRQQIDELQQQLTAVNQQRGSKRNPDSKLQARLDQLESERQAAEQQLEQLQQQLEAAEQQRASENEHTAELQARLDHLEGDHTAAEQQLEQLQQQLVAVDQQRVSERDHGSQLQARLDQLETEQEAAHNQIEQLQQQLETTDQQHASENEHSSELQARLDQLESERQAAEQQLEQLQQQLEAAEQQQATERDHSSELQAQLDLLEGEREAANQQIAQLQQQLEAAGQQQASERDHEGELQARLDQLASEREAADRQIGELQQQVEQLQQQLAAVGGRRNHTEPPDRVKRRIHELLTQPESPSPAANGEMAREASRINVRLFEGVFSPDERRELAKGLIKAVVGVKGESFRSETEVLIAEVPVGNGHERAAIAPDGADEAH
ncbi:MAG TPA: hypothetical protein VNH40_13005 [Gaiellaceae bacterium]|nr:hypothetical protein [Gaiellaceae bacterium]